MLSSSERCGSTGSRICQLDSEYVHLTCDHWRGLVHLPPRLGFAHPRCGRAPFHPRCCQTSVDSWAFQEAQWIQAKLSRLKSLNLESGSGCVMFFVCCCQNLVCTESAKDFNSISKTVPSCIKWFLILYWCDCFLLGSSMWSERFYEIDRHKRSQ